MDEQGLTLEMLNWFNKEGKKITFDEFCSLQHDKNYCIIKTTKLDNDIIIITQWTGFESHIFNTEVRQSEEDLWHLDYGRYMTERDAREGHLAMCEKWKNKICQVEEGSLPLLIEAENELDKLNGQYGDLCLFCKSKEYNGKEGIVHTKDCLMTRLKKEIKNDKE